MKEFLFQLGLILIFMYISYHLYVDISNYRNSYTELGGGVFLEGMHDKNENYSEEYNPDLATSQPEIENEYASVENPVDFSIFNKDIMKRVLASKDLIPEDINLLEESQTNYIRIGKSFIEEVSIIRNFSVPNIDETDYETLGRFVTKIKAENASEAQKKIYSEQILMNVHNMLISSTLSHSSVEDEYNPKLSTNKRTTGMLGDNGNALMSKKLKLAGIPDDKPKFTDSYNVKKLPEKAKPYNSAWSLF